MSENFLEQEGYALTKDYGVGNRTLYNLCNTYKLPKMEKITYKEIKANKQKLKENFDENIINKVLNTNRKLDLSYTDSSNVTNTKSSDITPKVKLTENLPTELPKAGTTIFFGVMGIVVVIAIAFGIKYILVKNSMK